VSHRETRAEQRRRADLAEAHRLGKEFGLDGEAQVTRIMIPDYRNAGWMAMLLTMGAAAIAAMVGAAAAGAALLAMFFAFVSVVTLGYGGCELRAAWSGATLRRFFRFPGGLVDLRSDEPEPTVLRWPEVDSVTLLFDDSDSMNGLEKCVLSDRDRTAIIVPDRRPMLGDLVGEAQRILGPKIVPSLIDAYESGQPVVFGGWRIDRTGVTEGEGTSRARLLPWAEVREIVVTSEEHRGRVDPPSLIELTRVVRADHRQPRRRAPAGMRLSLSDISNGLFLPNLLEHIADRENVPLRRIVVPPGKG
jgi:hypothetical protein